MVSLKDIKASNKSLQELPPGIVLVLVGATSGIGLATLEALAENANGPRVYIITREKVKANHVIDKLKLVNPMGTFMAIEGQFSVIREVDRMCEEIKKFETHIDILCMSPGNFSINKHRETPEGINTNTALQFYSRLRLITNLLPLLERSVSPRVISIGFPGFEGPIPDFSSPITASNDTMTTYRSTSTLTSLSLEELAKSHPTVSFIHSYPGQIGGHTLSKTLASTPGLLWFPAQMSRFTVLPVYEHFMCISPSEAGERILFLATSTRFPPTTDHGDTGKIDGFVERPNGVGVARSTVMKAGKGNGVYRVNWNGEVCRDSKVLDQYRSQDFGKVVMEHRMGVFQKALDAKAKMGNGN